MAKIPLERTIESTYSFAFKQFFSVLGVLWLPFVILGCVTAAFFYFAWPDFQHMLSVLQTARPGEAASQDEFMSALGIAQTVGRFATLIWLMEIVVLAMVWVGVTEKALGLREGPVFFYFSLGAPVWRMIGATILATLVIVVMACLTMAAVAAILYGTEQFAGGVVGLVKFVVIAAAGCWMIYMPTRLFFFLPAVVVAEGRIGLGRSWELGGGNFWRIIALLIAVLLPFFIVSGIVGQVMLGSVFFDAFRTAAQSGHELQPAEVAPMLMRTLGRVWPFIVIYEVITGTLATGLWIGAVAKAYKGTVEGNPATASEAPA